MLDIKFVRENPEIVKQNIRNKFQDNKLELVDKVIALDKENREIKQEVEALRAQRNKISKQIGALMGQGKKEEAEEVKKQVAASGARIEELSAREKEVEEELLKDMMVISNSTVFAFNNYGLPNSSYVRDLVDFHVCCVQHGMSVQKIAVAQNRLRDNTRLYFCASKYELENLSKPIYDYEGYDALKLTGVPRYDGLKNDDKKQIMISPTWRMQAAVPVRTSEGEQRDYNPLFKESTSFQVFNALINDPRLIEAAKKYGYRIKYVLHPIVSAQVNDFDKNDYVDIIPAVGDMSYETMFRESSLMVTDFSGIQFDFAYMRKPVVYLHHHDIPKHYEEGTFHYDTMGFGEICEDNDELIDVLISYMQNNCEMKPEYRRRADDFFRFDDHDNCERIYDVMIDYQKTKIH